ncbi:MAG: hypothetical protein HC811_12410 [Flammeovirgaceae bacterium]|nr:hypothetical protein [Flammeovirgaceae bacterium]
MITFIFSFFLFLHPIHISVTEIEYNEKNKSIEIISRIFIDDLELSIRNTTGDQELDLLNPPIGNTTDQLVRDYLKDRMVITVDKKKLKINYLGHEVEDLSLVCYLEVENAKKFKSIEVMNSIISETHDDQSNLVHVTLNGKVKSLRLMKENSKGILNFD